MKKSEITIGVELDNDHVPEKLSWQAEDAGVDSARACKAMMLSVFDESEQNTLRIDLWTKDMPLDDMKRFFYESFMSMADTYLRASSDEDAAALIRKMAREFGEQINLLKK